ncbi:MAG TPA: nickel-binding protein [Acidimicrobiales bacterium]|nr:nickel-binding protein [Acidimicrobiales bacterium]
MPEFLVEVYVSPATGSLPTQQYQDVSAAVEEMTGEGTHVRLVRSILVPEDETCFYLFQAQTGDAVREAAARAGLRFERVMEAVAVKQNEPRATQEPIESIHRTTSSQ